MKVGKKMNRWIYLSVALLVLAAFTMVGCSGDDGTAGIAGAPGAPGAPATVDQIGTVVDARLASTTQAIAAAQPESCSVCHAGAGDKHQASYNELYQDGVIKVTNLAYAYAAGTATLTFQMKKAGVNFDCTQADSLGSYYAAYDGTGFPSDLSLMGTKTYDATTNVCTSTKTFTAAGDIAAAAGISASNGIIQLYGVDEVLYKNSVKHISSGKYPFAAILKLGTVNYTSAANVSGCEKCHTKPYLKHTYIYGAVNGTDDFYTCKGCHYDNRTGGHTAWQLLVDDVAAYAAQNGVPTAAQKTKYAYKAKLMNDVHMSHAMEFGYPQSMANCATCHAGKLAATTTDANFNLETCKSCHPVTGVGGTEAHRAPALATVIPHGIPFDEICNTCHKAGGIAPEFKTIHTGYNKMIYADAVGTKYSAAITASIDSASLSAANVLTINFSAAGSAGGLNAANIVPTVMVGLYGYNTKDFLVSPHGKTIDTARDLEWAVGTTNARFTTVSAANGSWVVTADLSKWADKIATGAVKRAEIAIMPTLKNTAGVTVALNAPSRTYNLVTKAFDDTFYSPIVKVTTGCNNCHDALATTFHAADRGGNIVVCRMCHTTASGGSHLEMQSRSIDSYVHAIHSFQPFDVGRALSSGGVDFTDPVQALHYSHKIESDYPTFGITNCQSCHNAGTYNVPAQSKSMPGVLSKANDTLANGGLARNIGAVPSYVAGPASRACGSCHRTELINEDKAGELASFNQHTKGGGFLVEATDSTVFDSLVTKMMGMFK